MARFSHSRVKRKLRRAERESLSVRRSNSERELLDVYYPLHVETRRRLGVPVQLRRFFQILWQEFLGRGLGFVVTARIRGVAVSSGVFLAWNRRMVFKYAASNVGLGNVGAGQATAWNAVRWGRETGHVDFDFGRTDLGDEGLGAFKRAWGTMNAAWTYTVLADRQPRPRWVRAGAMLRPVLRNSPKLMTRVIGRVGYRHTA
jgi:lipid II:glycine glycyltransferase (peptidoglycan interpeptide bridge formation enzyme)